MKDLSRILLLLLILISLQTSFSALANERGCVVNPVIKNYLFHDNSWVMGPDSVVYAFVAGVEPRDTADHIYARTISLFKSDNLIDWTFYKYVFPDSCFFTAKDKNIKASKSKIGIYKLQEVDNIKLYPNWAPDIIRYKDKYLLFTSLRGDLNDTKVVLFISDSINHDFKFKSIVVSNTPSDGTCYFHSLEQIDPFPIVDDGRLYLVFGSFARWTNGKVIEKRRGAGVYIVELDSDNGYSMKGDPTFLTDYYEGVIILKHDGGYYLLGTNGSLKKSTYQVSCARSDSLVGPYLTKEGKSIADTVNVNFAEPILSTTSNMRFTGFGCPTTPITDRTDRQWMMISGHDTEITPIGEGNAQQQRYAFLVEIQWDEDGYPMFDLDAIESNKQPVPNF